LKIDAWAPSASIFKVVSAAALVEAGVKRGDKVCYHGGIRSVTESNLVDDRQDNRCDDLAYGIAHSQNAIVAKFVHQHLTPKDLSDVAHRFGFDRELPLATPGAFGHITVPADNGVDFAKTAAGFTNVQLSAVGGAFVANTIATGGISAPARIIAGYQDGSNPSGPMNPAPIGAGRRVLEQTVADEVGAMMAETCTDGSAAKAFAGRDRIPDVTVAGKTGTLSNNVPFYMQYSWFVGFAPADKPSLSIAVLIGNPEKWQIKAHTAARMVLIEALRTRAGS
jgi:penicillin-binding protein A